MRKILDLTILLLLLLLMGVGSGRILGYDIHGGGKETALSVQTPGEIGSVTERFFPGADKWTEADTSTLVIYKGDEKIGTILFSEPYTISIRGYFGTTPLVIVLDAEDVVSGVELLDNIDSPDYVEHVKNKGLLSAWVGIPASKVASIQIDAVSGATYTSRGIIESMKRRMAVYEDSDLSRSTSWGAVLRGVALAIFLAVAIFAFLRPGRIGRWRWIIMALSVAMLGIWQGNMLSLAQTASWIVNGIPIGVQWGLFLMALIAVMLPLFTGKAFYCTWVCPFGACQELVGKCNKKKTNPGFKTVQWLKALKRAILFGLLLTIGLGGTLDLAGVEPFAAFNPQAASWTAVVIAVVSLILSIFVNRPWCRFLCPTGEILEMVRRNKTRRPQ